MAFRNETPFVNNLKNHFLFISIPKLFTIYLYDKLSLRHLNVKKITKMYTYPF